MKSKLSFGVWFDRNDPLSIKSVPELERYATGQHWVSIKQAPCATSLKMSGSSSLTKDSDIILTVGGPIVKDIQEDSDLKVENLPDSYIRDNFSDDGESDDILNIENPSDAELSKFLTGKEPTPDPDNLEGLWERPKRTKGKFRFQYDDPWKIFAGRILASVRSNGSKPELSVWYGDLNRLQDPIPTRLLGNSFRAGLKSKKKTHPIRFHLIKNVECQLHLIKFHTHWGNTLWKLANGSDITANWARTLKERIKSFIKGRADPLWSNRERAQYYADPENIRNRSSRCLRLIEVLKTADGMFVQRYLAFPEEVWSWEKYDLYLLRNISYLISDEFFDGELTEMALDIPTYYKSLKDSRKSFKDLFFKEDTFEINRAIRELPDWLRHLGPVWKKVFAMEYSEYKVFILGILSQTRGCGTPPLVVTLQSKRKFVQVVSSPVERLSETTKGLIRASIGKIIQELPDYAFTGLETKARVTLTTSACLEQTVKEGGTVQAIADLLFDIPPGTMIPIRNLETGKIDKRVPKESLTIGELTFWHSVQKVVQTNLEDLRTVYLLIVKEPGKARSVTKSLSYLKVVLDVVSKICSHPLKKGISSSESGMSKESHGWNFCKHFFEMPKEIDLFKVINLESKPLYGSTKQVTETYKTVFVSSTDYETATDYMNHEVASIISETWMLRCGIPKFLRGIVHGVCYKPRKILFSAKGPLRGLGEPTDKEDIRCITTTRGVLMGDPLTKPCLHLINVSVRVLAENCTDVNFLSRVFGNSFEAAKYFACMEEVLFMQANNT